MFNNTENIGSDFLEKMAFKKKAKDKAHFDKNKTIDDVVSEQMKEDIPWQPKDTMAKYIKLMQYRNKNRLT